MKPPIYFECQFCKAQPFDLCKSKSGKLYHEYNCHQARIDAQYQSSDYSQAIALLKRAIHYAKHKYTCTSISLNVNNCSCGLIKLYNDFDREMTYWELSQQEDYDGI